MGLMKFLAAGRSLGRIADEPSRYRMDQRGLLPRFGFPDQKGQPVWLASRREPGGELARSIPARQPVAVRPGPKAANDQSTMKSTETKPAAGPAPGTSTAAPKRRFGLGRWSFFRNPFAGRNQTRAAKPPVQCELSLDAVKPVRNDLSDSDLEVVAAARQGSESLTAAKPLLAAPLGAVPAVPVWGRIKNQYFGAGRT